MYGIWLEVWPCFWSLPFWWKPPRSFLLELVRMQVPLLLVMDKWRGCFTCLSMVKWTEAGKKPLRDRQPGLGNILLNVTPDNFLSPSCTSCCCHLCHEVHYYYNLVLPFLIHHLHQCSSCLQWDAKAWLAKPQSMQKSGTSFSIAIRRSACSILLDLGLPSRAQQETQSNPMLGQITSWLPVPSIIHCRVTCFLF